MPRRIRYLILGLMMLLSGCSIEDNPVIPDIPFKELATYTIIAPASGDVWLRGGGYEVHWRSILATEKTVRLYLVNRDRILDTLVEYTGNDGYTSVFISSTMPVSDSFRILIQDADDISLYSYSAFFTIGMVYDSTDTDYNTAATLVPGERLPSLVLQPNDTDWFCLQVDSGITYDVQTDQPSNSNGFYHYLTLYFPDTSVRLPDFQSNHYRRSERVWTATGSGLCRIRFHSGYSDQAEEYRVTVDTCRPPIFHVIAPAAGTTLYAGMRDSLVLSYAENTGEYVNARLYSKRQLLLNTTLYLTGTDGLRQWGTVVLPMVVDRTDSCYWMVRPEIAPECSTRSGWFLLELGSSSDSFEPDNSPSQAGPLVADGSSEKHTLSAGDTDCFYWTSIAGATYVLETGGNIDTRLSLLDSTGSDLIRRNDDGGSGRNAQIIWTASTGGRYLVKVDAILSSINGPYSISLRRGTAPAMYFISFLPDVPFDLGSALYLNWDTVGSVGKYVNLTLFSNNSFHASIATRNINDGDYYWTLPLSLDTNSTYQFRLEDFSNPACSILSSGFRVRKAAGSDTFEPDDSAAHAKTLDVDSVQRRTLTVGDMDWVLFNAKSGRTYIMTALASSRLTLAFHEEPFLPYLISSYAESDNGYQAKITWVCSRTGTYWMLLKSNNSTNTVNYHLTAQSP